MSDLAPTHLQLLNIGLLTLKQSDIQVQLPTDPSVSIPSNLSPFINCRTVDINSLTCSIGCKSLVDNLLMEHDDGIMDTKNEMAVISKRSRTPNDPPHTFVYTTHDTKVEQSALVAVPPEPNSDFIRQINGNQHIQETTENHIQLFIRNILSVDISSKQKLIEKDGSTR
jgi:hypothetical protein